MLNLLRHVFHYKLLGGLLYESSQSLTSSTVGDAQS
ncbi:hypothetical protein MCC10128_1989 [Bifidobacterium longum subsp. longum]|nr:hypothetical protein MCC10128_1989 [Bifidobacterium longum subsp. longum]